MLKDKTRLEYIAKSLMEIDQITNKVNAVNNEIAGLHKEVDSEVTEMGINMNAKKIIKAYTDMKKLGSKRCNLNSDKKFYTDFMKDCVFKKGGLTEDDQSFFDNEEAPTFEQTVKFYKGQTDKKNKK